MTTGKNMVLSVLLPAALLLATADVQSQAVPGRAFRGGGIHRARPDGAPAPLLHKTGAADPLPAGSYTVGTAGYFPTLDSAFSRLSGGGILGGVTLLLTDTLYVASPARGNMFTLQGPVAGTGPTSRITIRPADNVAATIRGSGGTTLLFQNVSYLTLDGVSLQGSTRLKVHTLFNQSVSWNDAIDLLGNCDSCVIQNLTAGSDDTQRLDTSPIALISDTPGAPDNCLVSGNFVTSGGMAIYVGSVGPSTPIRPKGNVIRGNHIGSPADSLISRGIQIQYSDGTTVENNHVENLRRTLNDPWGAPWVLGINTYATDSTVIRNNVVHGLRGSGGAQVGGISGTGAAVTATGSMLRIYNNMVYDIANYSTTGTPWTEGIVIWRNSDALIAYNSVHISGTGTSTSVSDGLSLGAGVQNCTLRNNIIVNTSRWLNPDNRTAMSLDPTATFSSDYNDLYADSALTLIAALGTGFGKLPKWQATGQDVHSVSMLPVFRAPDLHLDSMHTTSEYPMNKGIPVAGILADFDGQLRDVSTPDIGADEIVEVRSTGGLVWNKDPRNPVLSGGGATGYSLAMNPFVIYNADSARFEMWYNRAASSSAARPWLVGFATSPDGVHWTQRASPVLAPTPGTWDANTTEVPTVIRENGTYKMWYSSFLGTAPNYMGYATSPDGVNWTKYAGNPIFGPGTAPWEAGGPFAASVMAVPGGYKIWYDAYDASANTSRIGYATSADGIVWQRDTVHNPILTLGVVGAWDDNNVGIPRVLKLRIGNSSDMYFMWYAASRSDGRAKSGLALSPDGITGWTKSPHNPVLGPDPGSWDGTDAAIGSVMLYHDSLHAWYDGGTRPSGTNLWHIGHATSRTPVTDVLELTRGVPAAFALEQNYPNPFNPTTTIRFHLKTAGDVRLVVYDLLGREVAVLVNGRRAAGSFEAEFNAAGRASGVYFYRLQAGSYTESKKLLLVK